ncbi:hypothetical protein HYALB_00011911 [Hymenoscyphus albidus]|uniref:Calcineurin-like phosphoesterase domain-containing protein n=1 Tax=Hymenoscyphus albidus TaxID=595503 RepID=A0A9N9LVB2_9HELO|nr:hypothetical protein HYALB_00011911 [Hymenoscyphus albidus]
MASRVKTRGKHKTDLRQPVMIISDTHDNQFNNATKYGGKFTLPNPQCDVLIHTGDLTLTGGEGPYQKSMHMLSQIPAELKLVIAGNHDLDLDPNWVDKRYPPTPTHLENHKIAAGLWKGPHAKQAGITYLEEGMYTFTLSNGAKFKVYASPYQPEFCGWVFPYERNEDRFNPPGLEREGVYNISLHPIPSFPDVDIVMTHGPPKGILDRTLDNEHPGEPLGCESLLRALGRARPKLACFGHIHEAYGMRLVEWKKEGNEFVRGEERYLGDAIERQVEHENAYPKLSGDGTWDIKHGEETLMVNSSIMNLDYRPFNSPWIFDIELPGA